MCRNLDREAFYSMLSDELGGEQEDKHSERRVYQRMLSWTWRSA